MSDPRYRGLPFMAPLVPLVLDGRKPVTRRVGRKPAEVGDLLWIREAWRLTAGWDRWSGKTVADVYLTAPPDDPCHGMRPAVFFEADRRWTRAVDEETEVGRYRHARFLPRDLARPWRGRVVSVERVPAPPEGIDDDEAIREGARAYSHAPEECRPPSWSLDRETWGDTPRDAFLAAWNRLHPDPSAVHAGGVPGHVWRVEWVTEVPRG